MGGPEDPGQADAWEANVQFCGDEWLARVRIEPDERSRVPQFNLARTWQPNGREGLGHQIRGLHRPPDTNTQ
jgi:hypothetical protein